jgi:peptidoglycan/LPS O-acetylase OafA/YrhL
MSKLNNLTELRLFFAVAVVISHAIQLAQFNEYDGLRHVFSSEVAVQGFFILSGFLVIGSYSRTLDSIKFYKRRFLRIYPGYLVAVLLFLMFALSQAYVQNVDVNQSQIFRYLVVNSLLLNFLQPGIDGVFRNGIYQEINGALWTIKLEVMFYALVPLLYKAGRRWSLRATGVALIIIGLSWVPLLEFVGSISEVAVHPALAHQLPGQLHFFGLGVLMFDVTQRPQELSGNIVIVLAAVLLSVLAIDMAMAVQLFLLSVFIFLVSQLPQLCSRLGGTDLSYGVYLSHFPIIQLLIGFGAVDFGFGVFLFLVLVAVTVYALGSWHLIECPAIELGRGEAA